LAAVAEVLQQIMPEERQLVLEVLVGVVLVVYILHQELLQLPQLMEQ
jgi:hypothetical protein